MDTTIQVCVYPQGCYLVLNGGVSGVMFCGHWTWLVVFSPWFRDFVVLRAR